MHGVKANASAITWMIGGQLAFERLDLAAVNGASVTLRRVSATDQDRWREKRRTRMMGYGALGDEGSPKDRSYPYLAVPEWVLDCCTVCVDVSRSAADVSSHTSGSLGQIAHEAAGSDELLALSTALADLLRIVAPTEPVQVPLHELLVVGAEGGGGFTASEKHSISLIPGFLLRHARDRWELSEAQGTTLTDWWPRVTAGPNTELLRWPLRRFGVSRQRAFGEDRLVDLTIALEGIYISEEESQQRGSPGDRIARRTNLLLGGDRAMRKLRTKRIIGGYLKRSDIVHGRLPSEDEIAAAATGLEAVLLETLRRLITETNRAEPWNL